MSPRSMRPIFRHNERVNQGVYIIRNTTNGKIYVGSSANIRRRWITHRNTLKRRKHHCRHLQGAWQKDGREAFRFEIVEPVDDTLFLEAREQFWMWRTKASDPAFGYNTSPAAGSLLGRPLPIEVRAKMSRTKKGVALTEDHRRALREAWAKNPVRRQAGKQLIKHALKNCHSQEWRQKVSAALIGKPKSDQHRAALSAALIGKRKSAAHVAKFTESLRGRKLSEQHKAAISKGLKKRV